jgi:hypothetical protein
MVILRTKIKLFGELLLGIGIGIVETTLCGYRNR